ncbi:MAG: phosphoglycerate kinase, partial [Flavobacteriales bacterium]|nr:phosphoglycerate kinase [Flavobacteriales bacterium]MDP4717870.1 phosphoglycerate kinase [Flavobacteriales bacterium]
MYQLDQHTFANKAVLVRVDFNVPLNEKFEVTDNTRIRAAAKTILKLSSDGAKVILMSHLGRPKGGPEDKFSLKHIQQEVSNVLGKPVAFSGNCVGEEAKYAVEKMKAGDILLLENLRFYKEEEGGDEFFAGQLAELGDVYVNDAFGTAHRAHASTAVIAKFFPTDKYFGYLMEDEVKSIDRVLNGNASPVTAIIGGSKVSSKIAILENLMNAVDNIIIGGGMAFTFIKAQQGKVGSSLVEDDKLDLALELMEMARNKNVNLYLPTDAIIADAFAADANHKECSIANIPAGWMGLDIGVKSREHFATIIAQSKTVLWNGPMGVFEMEAFAAGTIAVANALVEATKNGSFTLIGGGDSVAAINQFGLANDVSYVSTGGGAMLESLEGIELPGVKA